MIYEVGEMRLRVQELIAHSKVIRAESQELRRTSQALLASFRATLPRRRLAALASGQPPEPARTDAA
jgi:hypothetical protein